VARQGLRALTLLALALGVWYFGWLIEPQRVGSPVLYGILLAAELFNAGQAAGFWWTCAHQRVRPSRAHTGRPAVDVLIPTYDEPVEVVEPTVAAAVSMTGATLRVSLLDDGGRSEMAELAARHGVRYLARERRSGAKAGNLNDALALTDAPFVLVLDCDHVPTPQMLERTLGHLLDEDVAFVQTPQYYANAGANSIAAAAWSQQALFFGPIARGKDGLGATFCAGTNVVFRRAALQQVGGFPEGSLTEDFELSLRLHERGWRSAYVPEALARGLGPEDMASYVSQQQRWARGCLSALPVILCARLPWRLRLQYLLSASYFLTGWTLLVYMALPVIRILTGLQPLASVSADQFLLHFAPYFIVALSTVALAGAGSYTFGAFALASASFWIHVHAAIAACLRRPARFVVTAKQGAAGRQPRVVAPALLALAALVGVSVYGVLRSRSAATLNNVAFAGLHTSVLLFAVWPALQRHRRPLAAPATAAGAPAPAPARTWGRRVGWPALGLAAAVPLIVAAVGGQALTPVPSLSERAHAAADRFLKRYVSGDGRVVRIDQGGDTVSEGQAYGMLLSVALDDKARFDTIWRWTHTHLQRPDGLLAYLWRNGSVVSQQPATDADLDAARALVLAAKRFGVPSYRSAGLRLERAILANETALSGGSHVLVAGPWARTDPRVVNPSYFSPRAYADLGTRADTARWTELAASSEAILSQLTARGALLPPDWAQVPSGALSAQPASAPAAGAAAAGSSPGYGLDASRVIIRNAESCLPADRRRAAEWPVLARLAPSLVATYDLRGSPRSAAPTATGMVAAAAAARAAGAQAASDRLLVAAEAVDQRHPTYYGAAWVALGRVMLTSTALGACGP
jgi:cellulose synthase (UDP-forming)